MLGFVHVFEHPYFAVTDERGAFVIPHIPAGTYTLKAWHEDAGLMSREITVSEDRDAWLSLEFSKK
jgi:hypothetical protein